MKKYSQMRHKMPRRKGWHIKNEPDFQRDTFPNSADFGIIVPLVIFLVYFIFSVATR